ncbi:MAG: acylneuraminate cytidylyltransferase family protein [Phycisphaerales bacterium]|nr:acylneuraminate cytidylyltransferase family protein [Phycisphaerales bacterium]
MKKPEARSQKPEVLAVIMARAGSVGLPNKSLRLLHGKSVIAYTFEHVRGSKLITRSVVSSDSAEILALAKNSGFETIERPAELATGTSATDPVLRHAVRELYSNQFTAGKRQASLPAKYIEPFAVVMLYGNVPLRANHMIDRCIQMLLDTCADSVQTIASVGKFHPYWMFDHDADGKIKKHIPNNVFRRQELPPLYCPTGAVYVMKTSVLMAAENMQDDPHAFLGCDRRGLIVNPEDSVDIDTEKDFYIAEALMRRHVS